MAHGHLWVLADGTPAHAPPGRLTRNEAGDVACHLCGRWFAHLGAHLRRHGWSAAQYREAVGLAANRALCNDDVSGRIGHRQAARWRSDQTLRRDLDRGREIAQQVRRATVAPRRVAPETGAANGARLQAIRAQNAARREHALAALAALTTAGSVADLLRGAYEAGGDLDDLQRLTGWSRERVRRELVDAGARIRGAGSNTASGRANRARRIDAEVSARVGTDDLVGWLRTRRHHGASVAQLAAQTGRSTAWVRARLRGTTTSAPAASSLSG